MIRFIMFLKWLQFRSHMKRFGKMLGLLRCDFIRVSAKLTSLQVKYERYNRAAALVREKKPDIYDIIRISILEIGAEIVEVQKELNEIQDLDERMLTHWLRTSPPIYRKSILIEA